MLQGLEFYLLDLKSKAQGGRQLFHDRYILLTDASGVAYKGFHLSNSIQGATRNEPLLVTPIPKDILPDVLDYVEGLIDSNNPSKKQTEIVTLYPNKKNVETSNDLIAGTSKMDKIHKIPYFELFFGTLFKNTSMHKPSAEEFKTELVERHLYKK